MIGLGLSLTKLAVLRSAVAYVLFIPSGSDSLITADSLTFKVRE